METPIALFWMRRDLRLYDNTGLYHALKSGLPVLPVFVFDRYILDKLEDKDDRRVTFIHRQISALKTQLEEKGSTLRVFYGKPIEVFEALVQEYPVQAVYTNRDYEPYANERDAAVSALLEKHNISFHHFKDQCLYELSEVVKDDGAPYTVYSPYARKWKCLHQPGDFDPRPSEDLLDHCLKHKGASMPAVQDMGFIERADHLPDRVIDEGIIRKYHEQRDIPSIRGTTQLSIHLRFGTVSIRQLARMGQKLNEKWLNELIWRDFYMMILHHFPHVVGNAFKPAYDRIPWRDHAEEFEAWCVGQTGYPIVDAGMRELNETGFMHNRVRMITASFLTKHLLIDWRWGEAYFAKKLNDFELSSNNGGWQWAAGSGCDAAPYFRVFNPELQTKKFDPQLKYVQLWVPEFQELTYARPIVDHKFARNRAIDTYKKALS